MSIAMTRDTKPPPTAVRLQPASGPRSWRRPRIGVHAAIAAMLFLSIIPVYLMVVVSFKNPLQYLHERWTVSFPLRILNYMAAWEQIGSYILNTFFVALVGFAGMVVLSTVSAYVFARMRFPFREHIYYAIIALLLVPWVLSFVPAYMVYTQFGLVDTYWALIVPRIVNGSIFGIFLLRAFFAGLPEEIFEAARIDGAGSFALIWHITIPMSTGILATLAVLDFIGAWNDFLWPFVAISSKSKRVISVGLYLLQADTAGAGLGPLFSGYTIASIPLAILFFALGKYYVEGLVESGLKA
ncbi:MAG: carbohydrate ABC transporter permease [Caldilineaceae bacterium SB0665_bin_21]|nr:carbohydrate ABC transporter permease [Caldilineaceae bacterium SB0665_bin_21]MYC62723.1 carbohydrate ABC transporter permease [Caldilineaceae bacterium SB0661_bin_34]